MTGRSMVRVIWSSASGNPLLAAGKPWAWYPNTTGNLVSAATSGRAAILAQSNPGWLGSTVAVAGSVRAQSRSNAVWPRRAPAMEVRMVAVARAMSRARTASDRQRLSPSRRSQVSVISISGYPAAHGAMNPPASMLSSRRPAGARRQGCGDDRLTVATPTQGGVVAPRDGRWPLAAAAGRGPPGGKPPGR